MSLFNDTNSTNASSSVSMTTDPTMGDSGSSSSSPSKEEITMKTIFVLIGLFGIVGNFLVSFVIMKVKSLRTLTNILICNQSLIDLTSSVLVIAINLGPNKKAVDVPPGLAGSVLCKLWLSRYLMWASFNISTFNLVAVTLERYVAIVFPVVHHNRFTAFKAKVVCVFVWGLGLAYQSYWAKANYNKNNGSCGVHYTVGVMQKVMGVLAFSIEYMLPLIAMTFCYGKMFFTLKRRSQNKKLGAGARSVAQTSGESRGNKNEEENPSFVRARKNVIKMLCIIFLTYAICWAPNQFMYLEYNLAGVYHSSLLSNVTVVMAFLNMCINPLIYCLKYHQFQDAVKQLFGCRCGKVADSAESSGGNTGYSNGGGAKGPMTLQTRATSVATSSAVDETNAQTTKNVAKESSSSDHI
ncbi:galanin receptor type 1-like [Glandiceps talaboti]